MAKNTAAKIKNESKTNGKSSSVMKPSVESKRGTQKRSRKSKTDRSPESRSGSSKKTRKTGKKDDKSSVLGRSFAFTPNAIESMVTGIDLLARTDEGFENPSRKKSKTRNETFTDSIGSTGSSPRADLILRLRIDRPPSISGSCDISDEEELAALFGTLGDGKSCIRVMLLNPDGVWSKRLFRAKNESGGSKEKETSADSDWIVKVHGYAATEKFWHIQYRIFPVICLTSITLLQQCEKAAYISSDDKQKSTITEYPSSSLTLGKPFFPANSGGSNVDHFLNTKMNFKAQAGTIGTFLKERGPFLTNEELAGSSKILDHYFMNTALNDANIVSANYRAPKVSSNNQNFKKVHDCLSRHSAMLTLRQSSSSPSSPTPTIATSEKNAPLRTSSISVADSSSCKQPVSPAKKSQLTQHAWELYEGALREFIASQMDRQKASLGTNAGRESAGRAEMVVERHNSTLELALKEKGPLSIELLEIWHKELLRDLHPEAGIIRTKKVRCGHTVFCPPKRIRDELELYCAGLKSLELRLDMANNALHVVLFAAVAMFGIVDIHPFVDGNGRLSRIVANYALKQLPFPVNLFATGAQRTEYVVALERTRHLLSMNCAYGNVSRDDLIQVLKTTGVFGSLVQLLIDRVARAATALTAIWEEKSGLAAEAAEARAARRVRERAARGTCMICLDEKPNIATLCCGNAIHLNCCAEWLSGSNKCPICRHEMPSISKRVVKALEGPEDRWEIRDDDIHLSESIEESHPANISREYQNLMGRFWYGVRNNRSHADRRVRQPPGPFRLLLSESDSDGSDDDNDFYLRYTTTSSDEEENVGEIQSLTTNGQDNSDANRHEAAMDSSISNEPGFDDQGNDPNDTTTAFSGDANHSENTDSTTTTTADESEESDTTTMQFSHNSSQERLGRSFPTICASAACRNRPAVDCLNSLCGRCCVLIGNFHCPRHNS